VHTSAKADNPLQAARRAVTCFHGPSLGGVSILRYNRNPKWMSFSHFNIERVLYIPVDHNPARFFKNLLKTMTNKRALTKTLPHWRR